MKKYLKILLPILGIGLLLFFGISIYAKINHKKAIEKKIKALPHFEYTTINNQKITPSTLNQNKKIILVFFNTECDFCQTEAQMLNDNIEKLKDYQILFFSNEETQKVQQFQEHYKNLNHDYIYFIADTRNTFTTIFDIKSFPTMLIYNTQQKLIEKHRGQVKIDKILKN